MTTASKTCWLQFSLKEVLAVAVVAGIASKVCSDLPVNETQQHRLGVFGYAVGPYLPMQVTRPPKPEEIVLRLFWCAVAMAAPGLLLKGSVSILRDRRQAAEPPE